MIPVRSQRRLIQEDYYPDEFKILVCCLLLNRTRGAQVRGVVDKVFARWPDAQSMSRIALSARQLAAAKALLQPLGFQNQRAVKLGRFALDYLRGGWSDPRELHGVGEYAFDCWRIFFLEELGDDPPNDHALVDYWKEAKAGLWPEGGWGPDADVQERRRRYLDALGRRKGRVARVARGRAAAPADAPDRVPPR